MSYISLGQVGAEVDVRAFLRCVQEALRRRGWPLVVNGRWDEATRTALWNHTNTTPLPDVGSNTRWIVEALQILRDEVTTCAALDDPGYGAAAWGLVELASDTEAGRSLEGEPSDRLPWLWFGVGVVAASTLAVTGWLWYRGRRRA